MGAQMRPRAPKRRSKDSQQTPKSAQELAKSVDSPKTGDQTLPKTSPVSPTTRCWLDLRGLLVSKGSSSDFFAISVAVRNACEVGSDPLKVWFCCNQSTGTAQARIQQKTSKNNAL